MRETKDGQGVGRVGGLVEGDKGYKWECKGARLLLYCTSPPCTWLGGQ